MTTNNLTTPMLYGCMPTKSKPDFKDLQETWFEPVKSYIYLVVHRIDSAYSSLLYRTLVHARNPQEASRISASFYKKSRYRKDVESFSPNMMYEIGVGNSLTNIGLICELGFTGYPIDISETYQMWKNIPKKGWKKVAT